MSEEEDPKRTLEYWREHRELLIRCHIRDANGRRVERPMLTKVPPWLAAGTFIGLNVPGYSACRVIVAASDLCIVECAAATWSIDTDIVVKHWNRIEVAP